MEYKKLKYIATYPTGKLNSNEAVESGKYPFFTCAHEIYSIDKYAYDGEYVLLGGNNASGDFPIFYYNGKFEAYQRTYLIQSLDITKYDTHYLYYSIGMRLTEMRANASGTATKFLTKPILDNLYIEDFDIEYQRKIVSILSSYDNLIHNNNKRIKVLEQMAENLYKEWFVRFRFPGYETAEFVDGVPKNWTYYKLKELLEIFYGKDHKNISDGNIPVFGSGGIMRYGNKALYEGEAVLIPRKGTLNNIMYYNGELWTVDTMFYAVSQIHNSAKYIYYTLSNFDMESYNSGAALPSMTTSILYNLKVLLPDKNALKKFDDIVGKIFDEKKCLEMQNKNLIKQRDYLLPRLMGGKLQVK